MIIQVSVVTEEHLDWLAGHKRLKMASHTNLVNRLYHLRSDEAQPNNELEVWRTQFDEMVSAVQDPDRLAEDAANAGLILVPVKELIISATGLPAHDRALTILLTIDSQMRENPQLLHTHVIPVLRRQPGLDRVVSALQASYMYDQTIKEIDVERNSSDSKISSCSPRQLQDPEEPLYIYISSGEESIVEEENIHGQGSKVIDISMMNCQQTDHFEEDESNSSAAECSDSDCDMSRDQQDKEQDHNSQSSVLDFDQIDITVLGLDDEQAVRDELMSLAAKYDSIGITLGLPSDELEAIGRECFGDTKRALGRVIQTWLKQSYNVNRFDPPSWRSLAKAVDSHAGGGNHALAKRIACRHKVRKRNRNSVDAPPTKISRIENAVLVKFRPKLADFYSKKPEVPEGTWPPVKKTQYVNLALIKQAAINFSKDYVRQTVHGSIDDIIKDKKQINYEDAFAEVEDGALVVLEGRPGCGKTTLMHKLSQDWEKGEILASGLFFLVHFRRFSNRSDVELSDILRAATMDYTDEDIKELCTCIEKDSGRGIIFALDGLDEYCPKSKQNLLYNLIRRERLTNAIVIVASRPAASQKFRKYATKHIEVLGFLKPQIHEYIKGYFSGCLDKAQGLLHYLDNHLNVMHMCYLPLHSAMVTYLYDMEGANLPQTETEIYKHFTLWTLIRSLRKRSDDPDEPFIISDFSELSPEDKLVFDLILELAFIATINSKQVFTLKEVQEHISERLTNSGSGSQENSLGLIVIDRYFVKYGLDEIYTFLHLTFQEFLCAFYIAHQTQEKQKEILETYGSKENLAEVWKFFCGVKCSPENFAILLHKAQCKVHAVKNRSRKILIPNTLLHLHCAYESQKEWMCSQIVEKHKLCIELHDQSLTPSDMTALGYVTHHSKIPIKELNITSCHLGVEGLAALLTEIGDQNLSLEKLSFSGTKIKQEMVEKFAAFLTICSSVEILNLSSCISKSTLTDISKKIRELLSVTTLDISCNRLGSTEGAVKGFIDKLPNLQTLKVHLYKDCQWYVSMKKKDQLKDISVKTLIPDHRGNESEQYLATCKELVLRWLKISDKEAEVIGERLKECSSLTNLSLHGNQIGDAGAQAIAEGCKLCPNLQEINLCRNQIGDAGAQAIADGCKLCPNLQEINLNNNQIGDAGAQAIAEGCKLCPNLQEINLSSNQIGAAGAQVIAEGCKLCPNLQNIHLNKNQIGDIGAQAIAEGCKLCPNLQTIYLSENQFGDVGAQAIAEGCKLCPGLQGIYLSRNQIGDAGAQAIAEGCKLCPNLQEIYLRNNSITDASVPHLIGLMEATKKLEGCVLGGNKFTDAGRSQLRQTAEKRNNDQANYVCLGLVV